MKIYIIYHIKEGPYGGVNQFLKALRCRFELLGVYTDEPCDADLFLFNSCNEVEQVIELKKRYPNKIFVQRIDGPIRLYNNMHDRRDAVTNTMNVIIADATIFQSEYSKKANLQLGLKENSFETVITNATNQDIFNLEGKEHFNKNAKMRIVATSWSSNKNKGFDVYEYLDKNLDFNRYEFSFVGNAPCDFVNIKKNPPMDSKELAEFLKKNDIYIAASKKDPCSNALIEALSCGLPALVRREGGHPEILKEAGECFENADEIELLLVKIKDNYEEYVSKIDIPDMTTVSQQYVAFFDTLIQEIEKKNKKNKRINGLKIFRIKWICFLWKISEKLKHFW